MPDDLIRMEAFPKFTVKCILALKDVKYVMSY